MPFPICPPTVAESAGGPTGGPADGGHPPSRPPRFDMVRDDELLALLLATWTLRTGRILPAETPGQLTPEQLVDFWADEQTAAGGPARPWGWC